MIDLFTDQRLTVSTDGTAGPYLFVVLEQLPQVKQVLKKHHVPFSVESVAISINDKPADVVVNFGKGANASHIQAILDRVH
jgi:hypothetical protein